MSDGVKIFSTAQCFVTSIWCKQKFSAQAPAKILTVRCQPVTNSSLRTLQIEKSEELYEIGQTGSPPIADDGYDHDYTLYYKATFTLEFCWILAAALIKIATVAFYWRLFGQALGKRRIMAVLAALTIVWGLSIVRAKSDISFFCV